MSFLQHALKLASLGFHVFPLAPDSKIPGIDDFPNQATRDPEKIKKRWIDPILEIEQPYNIGISTTKFGDNEALIVIDVDNKDGKNGDEELKKITSIIPHTYTQGTPTGGRHLVFRNRVPVKQGTNVIGPGLDVRSKGGYIVGAGSSIGERNYNADFNEICQAPEWLVTVCGKSKTKEKTKQNQSIVDQVRAKTRSIDYLEKSAPISLEGQSGDHVAFTVACRLKDFGCTENLCLELMGIYWNDRCVPPWTLDDLQKKIQNAFNYGIEPVGSASPETEFTKVEQEKALHPFDKLNKEYAYLGDEMGVILKETVNSKGKFKLKTIPVPTFHTNLASKTMFIGGKTVSLTKEWIKSPLRRTYDSICFSPGKTAPSGFYNLWKGFSVEPEKISNHFAVDKFLEHALVNVCEGEQKLYEWLIGYFAHLVQRPWEKPLTALVFKGKKGVGKNALVERVGYLLGDSFAVVSNRRHLIGNFNSMLENKLFLTLDEAFWSGDKASEGILKDLITGADHIIERKGLEPYKSENLTRVAILGNEDWLVPATEDERRFAVFTVGDGRRRDNGFFRSMREGMEAGGYCYLLRYLLDFDLSMVDVDTAPTTRGLLEQKEQSLSPLKQWWRDCLAEKRVVGSDFEGWPGEVGKQRVRDAYQRYLASRNMLSWSSASLSAEIFSKKLMELAPSIALGRRHLQGSLMPTYKFSTAEAARNDWEDLMGQRVIWSDEQEKEILL